MRHSQYFKGWYFKCCADDKTIAFIPAYHSNGSKASASLQIITDGAEIPFRAWILVKKWESQRRKIS